MMKILLINPHVSDKYDLGTNIIPLGLAYVGTALELAGKDIEVLDIFVNKLSKDAVKRRLEELLSVPIWIGITGIINGFNYIQWLCSLIKEIKPEVPIVLGGPICTPNTNLLLKSVEADICCVGDGEETMRELSKVFDRDMDILDVKGIVFKKDGEIHSNGQRSLEKNLSKYDFPAWNLFDIKRYLKLPGILKSKPAIHLIGSRGCPFGCRFCSTSNKTVRRRTVESVVQEIKTLHAKYGIDHFEFADEFFLFNEKSIVDFCNALLKIELKITWFALGRVSVVNKLSTESLQLLKRSGCHWMGFGVESGSQRILDAMNKGITIEESTSAIKKLRNCGIFPACSFIIGYPGETEDTIRETIEFCKSNLLPSVRFNYLTPLPGSEVYEDALKKGFIKNEIEYWKAIEAPFHDGIVINMTSIPEDELVKLKINGEQEVKDSYLQTKQSVNN
jgi:radical SAM superfamily enzyme YgiQ (UPF0313 family)